MYFYIIKIYKSFLNNYNFISYRNPFINNEIHKYIANIKKKVNIYKLSLCIKKLQLFSQLFN